MTFADIADLRENTLYVFRFNSDRPAMRATVLGVDPMTMPAEGDRRGPMGPFMIVKDQKGFEDVLDMADLLSIEGAEGDMKGD